jgi:hypothetical protein
LFAVASVLLALALTAGLALAQSGGGYDLSWSTADGGGGTSSGGNFRLSGTAGQPDTGAVSGGAYRLSGGFWGGSGAVAPPDHRVYIPLLLRDHP